MFFLTFAAAVTFWTQILVRHVLLMVFWVHLLSLVSGKRFEMDPEAGHGHH